MWVLLGAGDAAFMRRYFDAILETEMLLRVVLDETEAELTVVTLYKTSKFAKYETLTRQLTNQ